MAQYDLYDQYLQVGFTNMALLRRPLSQCGRHGAKRNSMISALCTPGCTGHTNKNKHMSLPCKSNVMLCDYVRILETDISECFNSGKIKYEKYKITCS